MHQLAFSLFLSSAAWFVFPEGHAWAEERETRLEPRGIVVGAHFLVDSYIDAERFPAWNTGGGMFVGYRSGRLTFGFDIALTSAPDQVESYSYGVVQNSYVGAMFGPTLHVAFLQSERRRLEGLALVGLRMGQLMETSVRDFFATREVVETTYGRIGYRLGLGVRGWIHQHVAASVLVAGTHTVLLDSFRFPSFWGFELLPGLMAMF